MSEAEEQQVRLPRSHAEAVWWKIKSEPIVPLFMLATVGALVGAFVKHRQEKPHEMNHWLRARVGFQGLAVVAVVGYAYLDQQKSGGRAALASAEKIKRDAEFQKRMQEVEEVQRLEDEAKAKAQAKQWWAMGWQGKSPS